jgi:hypothetical protein
MKLILIALAVSFLLVLVYTVFAVIVGTITGGGIVEMHQTLAWPLSLPKTIYERLAPLSIQEAAAMSPTGGMAESLIFFFSNVLIYSVPIYFLMLTFKRRRTV